MLRWWLMLRATSCCCALAACLLPSLMAPACALQPCWLAAGCAGCAPAPPPPLMCSAAGPSCACCGCCWRCALLQGLGDLLPPACCSAISTAVLLSGLLLWAPKGSCGGGGGGGGGRDGGGRDGGGGGTVGASHLARLPGVLPAPNGSWPGAGRFRGCAAASAAMPAGPPLPAPATTGGSGGGGGGAAATAGAAGPPIGWMRRLAAASLAPGPSRGSSPAISCFTPSSRLLASRCCACCACWRSRGSGGGSSAALLPAHARPCPFGEKPPHASSSPAPSVPIDTMLEVLEEGPGGKQPLGEPGGLQATPASTDSLSAAAIAAASGLSGLGGVRRRSRGPWAGCGAGAALGRAGGAELALGWSDGAGAELVGGASTGAAMQGAGRAGAAGGWAVGAAVAMLGAGGTEAACVAARGTRAGWAEGCAGAVAAAGGRLRGSLGGMKPAIAGGRGGPSGLPASPACLAAPCWITG